jgi:hypothetical protein
MRSSAFSFFKGFNSDFARSEYESRVREKEVREAEIWPSREGVKGWPGGAERSRFREVDCLRAVLKRVFCEERLVNLVFRGGEMRADHVARF